MAQEFVFPFNDEFTIEHVNEIINNINKIKKLGNYEYNYEGNQDCVKFQSKNKKYIIEIVRIIHSKLGCEKDYMWKYNPKCKMTLKIIFNRIYGKETDILYILDLSDQKYPVLCEFLYCLLEDLKDDKKDMESATELEKTTDLLDRFLS